MTVMQSAELQRYTITLSVNSDKEANALTAHPQIPFILDVLSRKDHHHVRFMGFPSEKIQLAFLKSITAHLKQGPTAYSLRNTETIYLNSKQLWASSNNSEALLLELKIFFENLQSEKDCIVLAINDLKSFPAFNHFIYSLMRHEKWRIILYSEEMFDSFIPVKLMQPSPDDLLNLLKSYQHDFETFHQVIIPEETFSSTLALASHYLTSQHDFDKALELLDSACARASVMDRQDSTGQFKPLVSNAALLQVISSWTQIPVSNLQNNSFQAAKLIESLHRQVHGQEAAIGYMGSILQRAYIKLNDKTGPLCTFLLIGSAEIGKTTAAKAMAEHLFGHKHALLCVNLQENYSSLSDVTITTETNQTLSLFEAVQKTPYAIVLLKDLQHASTTTLNLFNHIFAYGYAQDKCGNLYDFKHTIFVLTTTLGSEHIAALTQTPVIAETNKTLDLMQLVLNEHHHSHPEHMQQSYSFQDICEELTPSLENYFPQALLQHVHIVPFMPLDYMAFEKIMRTKMKMLAQRVAINYGIELNYAPEVIKFLAHEAFWRKPHLKTLEKLLDIHLYGVIANEILSRAEDKNRSRQLFIQLNEDGELLRCETGMTLPLRF